MCPSAFCLCAVVTAPEDNILYPTEVACTVIPLISSPCSHFQVIAAVRSQQTVRVRRIGELPDYLFPTRHLKSPLYGFTLSLLKVQRDFGCETSDTTSVKML